MSAKRIAVVAVQFEEGDETRVMVPLRTDDDDWVVLAPDGASYWDDADAVRGFVAGDWDGDPPPPELVEAYNLLADLMDELDPGPT